MRTATVPHVSLLLVLGLLTVTTSVCRSQSSAPDKRYFFYHGTKSASGFVEPSSGGSFQLVTERKQHADLSAKSIVCVTVVNAQPLNYAYSLSVSIDSAAPTLPDLTKQGKLLGALLPTPPPAAKDRAATRAGGDSVAARAAAAADVWPSPGNVDRWFTLPC